MITPLNMVSRINPQNPRGAPPDSPTWQPRQWRAARLQRATRGGLPVVRVRTYSRSNTVVLYIMSGLALSLSHSLALSLSRSRARAIRYTTQTIARTRDVDRLKLRHTHTHPPAHARTHPQAPATTLGCTRSQGAQGSFPGGLLHVPAAV